jgi:hypothetical protein
MGSIFKGQASSWTASSLKMGLIFSPKKSVSSHLTPRNNREDGKIQFNVGGSLRFLATKFLFGVRNLSFFFLIFTLCSF